MLQLAVKKKISISLLATGFDALVFVQTDDPKPALKI
jgi:hypothetical protein